MRDLSREAAREFGVSFLRIWTRNLGSGMERHDLIALRRLKRLKDLYQAFIVSYLVVIFLSHLRTGVDGSWCFNIQRRRQQHSGFLLFPELLHRHPQVVEQELRFISSLIRQTASA